MAAIFESVSAIFSSAVSMASTAASTIAGNPMLLVFWVLPLVGIGIGILKRLK